MVDMKGVEKSLPLGVRIRMMRKKGELSQKNGYSCIVVLLRLKPLLGSDQGLSNTTKRSIVALHPSIT